MKRLNPKRIRSVLLFLPRSIFLTLMPFFFFASDVINVFCPSRGVSPRAHFNRLTLYSASSKSAARPQFNKSGHIIVYRNMSNSPTLEQNYITFLKIVLYMLNEHRTNTLLITFYQLIASNLLTLQPDKCQIQNKSLQLQPRI